MANLLYIQSSPREDSISKTVADAFVEKLLEKIPKYELDVLNLFEIGLPEFRAPQAKAKYTVMSGKQPQGEAEHAWKQIIDITERFKSADAYVIASPMWNFSIPYKLKQYIDIIVQPGLTFSYDHEQGYTGLIEDKPTLLVLARGGDYAQEPAQGLDHQRSYLEDMLGFIGLRDIHTICVEPTIQDGPQRAEQIIRSAISRSVSLVDHWKLPNRTPQPAEPIR